MVCRMMATIVERTILGQGWPGAASGAPNGNRPRRSAWGSAFDAGDARDDISPRLAEIQGAGLVIHGDKDAPSRRPCTAAMFLGLPRPSGWMWKVQAMRPISRTRNP